jgi:hypothetical protein
MRLHAGDEGQKWAEGGPHLLGMMIHIIGLLLNTGVFQNWPYLSSNFPGPDSRAELPERFRASANAVWRAKSTDQISMTLLVLVTMLDRRQEDAGKILGCSASDACGGSP